MRCRTNGHTKDDCPAYMNYISSSAPNPLSTQGLPWCNICQTRGHCDVDCMFLHKTVCTLASLYCKFCRYVGHDEKDYGAYQLLREKIVDAYLMKTEELIKVEKTQVQFQAAPQFQVAPQFHPAQSFQATPQFQPAQQFQMASQFQNVAP